MSALGGGATAAVRGRVEIVVLGLGQRGVQLGLVEARGLQRAAAAAMAKGEARRAANMVGGDLVVAVERGQCRRRAGADDVGAVAVDAQAGAGAGDQEHDAVRQADRPLPRGGDALGDGGLFGRPRRGEARRVAVERQPATNDLDPHRRIERAGDLDREPEPVEQLRAQVALLRVHRPDEHEPGVIGGRQPVALDVDPPERGRVEQHVDEVVGQQVDLVHVEQAADRRSRAGRA